MTDLPYVVSGGHKRILACLPPHADFGGLKKFREVAPAVPRSDWKPVFRRPLFPAAEWVMNQGQVGSCVGNGSAGALRRARVLAGETDMPLSPGALYAQINGGRDNGAVISDALTALQTTGTCSYATVGEEPYYLQQLPAGWKDEAARFKIAQAYHCQTFDEICSAIQLGFVVVYGIMVGRNFESFDKNGVAGSSAGPGNHCMMADGMVFLPDGTPALDNVNSWGANWGPFGLGRCYLVQRHFERGDQPDAYAIQAPNWDPLDPTKPPTAL